MPIKFLIEKDQVEELVFLDEAALVASMCSWDKSLTMPGHTCNTPSIFGIATRLLGFCDQFSNRAERDAELLGCLCRLTLEELRLLQVEPSPHLPPLLALDESFNRFVGLTTTKQLLVSPSTSDVLDGLLWRALAVDECSELHAAVERAAAAEAEAAEQGKRAGVVDGQGGAIAVALARLCGLRGTVRLCIGPPPPSHTKPPSLKDAGGGGDGAPARARGVSMTLGAGRYGPPSPADTPTLAHEPTMVAGLMMRSASTASMARRSSTGARDSGRQQTHPLQLDPSLAGLGDGSQGASSNGGGGGGCGIFSRRHNIRIFLVRHGQSEGNVNKSAYNTKPDHALELTSAGKAMARAAGRRLRTILEKEYGCKENLTHHVRMWVSPYTRTRQTAEEMLSILNPVHLSRSSPAGGGGAQGEGEEVGRAMAADEERKASAVGADSFPTIDAAARVRSREAAGLDGKEEDDDDGGGSREVDAQAPGESDAAFVARRCSCWVDSVRESPFLAEQDFGSFEGDSANARERYLEEYERLLRKRDFAGQYWSRWPHGESAFDVCVRMAGIFSDLTAGFTLTPPSRPPIRTVIIVSHGVTIRAFLSTWCRYSPEWMAKTTNPPNCSIQMVEDFMDCGFVFGGFEKDLNEVPLESLPRIPDDSRMRWDAFLPMHSA